MATSAINALSPLDSFRPARKQDLKQIKSPGQPGCNQQLPPESPLLHSHFARASMATTSSADSNSFSTRSSVDSRASYNDLGLQYGLYSVRESLYFTDTTPPALRDSWQSTDTAGPGSMLEGPATPVATRYETQPTPSLSFDRIPTVVVSAPSETDGSGRISWAGKAPITVPAHSNFSRPVRPPVNPTPESEEQKRRVLERNRQRSTGSSQGPANTLPHCSPAEAETSPGRQRLRVEITAGPNSHHQPSSTSPQTSSGSSPPRSLQSSPRRSSPLNPNTYLRADSPTNFFPSLQRHSGYASATATHGPSELIDPRKYSPVLTDRPRSAPPTPQNRPLTSSQPRSPATPVPPTSPRTPQDYLQLGIKHHEANRLKESAQCFERSANYNGGCGVGMLMWGLTLRHGWGCERNERTAFKWLRSAAESAVSDLENARTGNMDMTAVQSELVLAIYEVGQCFFQGWGVVKDQKMAVSYYTVAAKLGDPDAQCDLAFCLANGRGCKKDRKEAAKWYRAAVAQGQSDVGLAWIYKEKFQ